MDYEYDVFISYSHQDEKWVMDKLVPGLKEAGLTIWQDRLKIQGGGSFLVEIQKGLKTSRVVIVIVTPEAMDSEYVKQEVAAALNMKLEKTGSLEIIPVILRKADLSPFLGTLSWVDFRDESNFDASLLKLIESIQSQIPENASLALEDIMKHAKKSIIISGHTLDKFTQDIRIGNALTMLLERNIQVTVILLNPHSSYSKAHEKFHLLESDEPAQEQISKTIQFFRGSSQAFRNSPQFTRLTVLLTNYMPRFRAIILDEEICYVNLYMYGRDVWQAPAFRLTRTGSKDDRLRYEAISDSIHQMIRSVDIVPLIKNGHFTDIWANSRIALELDSALMTDWFRNFSKEWDTICHIILGFQNERHESVYELALCDQTFQPGTFTLEELGPTSTFFETNLTFEKWVNTALNEELNLINTVLPGLSKREKRDHMFQMMRTALNANPVSADSPLKCKIWYQEYPDIVHRLVATILTSNPDLELNTFPHLTYERRDFIFAVLDWLEATDPTLQDWLHLSIAAELLGIDEMSPHATASPIHSQRCIQLNQPDEDWQQAIERVGRQLWETAHTNSRIDATNIFFHTLSNHHTNRLKLVSFADDYLATIILLKYYEKLIEFYPDLEINFVPRSIRCANDASYEDVQGFLERFSSLKNESRFILVPNGPNLGGVNLFKLHPDILRMVDEASILDVRGARSYEMMQGIYKEIYFGFMVYREMSESVIGLSSDERPLIFLRQCAGEHSFRGVTQRHLRQPSGKMLAELTANDQKTKWEGGYLASLELWSEERKIRYEVLRNFYSDKSPEFHEDFGKSLEPYVCDYLDQLSGRILVIGCGSGKEVSYLANRGSDVYGFDFSPDAIRMAQREHPQLKRRFWVDDLYNLPTILSGGFDGIVANAVLVHLLEHEDLRKILKYIYDRLNKNGVCFIRVLNKGNTSEEMDGLRYHAHRWFVYYSSEELREHAKALGFDVQRIEQKQHDKFSDVTWISALYKRPD